MTTAITYNNAGIVEAIKRNSGSTKFYKPSYQGIIEAIQDWSGSGGSGGGTSVIPNGDPLPNPGNEGDIVVTPNATGDYYMYVYAGGTWERLHITTEEVEVAGSAPFAIELPDGSIIRTQADINAHLDERITALSEKGYDDSEIQLALATEIEDREAGDEALQQQIDNLPPPVVPVTYQIQTDKILRAGEPAIELVDSEGFFSNVKFEAIGQYIDVDSTGSSIVFDATELGRTIDTNYDTQADILMTNINQDNRLDTHASQINALETQIQLLAQAQAAGKWKYLRQINSSSPRPPSTGTFYGTHKDNIETYLTNWSDVNLIMISKTDLDSKEFTFSAFEEGDKVEILDTDGSSFLYGTVFNNPNQEAYGNIRIAVERSSGGPRDDKEYLVSVYRPGAVAGEVDLDILDARYLKYTGGNLTGNLNTNSLIKSTRDSGYAFQVKPNDVTANAYIHSNGNAEFKNLFISNESINTDNIVGRPFEITGRLSDGTTISPNFFYMYNNNDGTASALNYNGKMDSDANLVNKGYVDDVMGTIKSGTSTSPSLRTGEMFWNTSKQVLYIGA